MSTSFFYFFSAFCCITLTAGMLFQIFKSKKSVLSKYLSIFAFTILLLAAFFLMPEKGNTNANSVFVIVVTNTMLVAALLGIIFSIIGFQKLWKWLFRYYLPIKIKNSHDAANLVDSMYADLIVCSVRPVKDKEHASLYHASLYWEVIVKNIYVENAKQKRIYICVNGRFLDAEERVFEPLAKNIINANGCKLSVEMNEDTKFTSLRYVS